MYVNCPSFVPGRAVVCCLCGICWLEWGWSALTMCPVFAHWCGAECASKVAVPVWSEDGFSLSAGDRKGRLEGETVSEMGEWRRERWCERNRVTWGRRRIRRSTERERQGCLRRCSGGLKKHLSWVLERASTWFSGTCQVLRWLCAQQTPRGWVCFYLLT